MATPGGMTPASLRAPPSPPRLRQAAQQSSGASDISCSYTFDGSESATVSGRGGAGPPTGAVIYPASDAPARMRLLINANLLKDTASRQRHLGSSAQQRKATNTYAKVALLLLLVTLAAGAPSGGMSAKPASRVHGHNPASKTPPSEGSGQVSAGPSHTSYHTASTGRLRGADAVAAARYTDNHEAAKISQSLRHAARADAAHHARRQLLGRATGRTLSRRYSSAARELPGAVQQVAWRDLPVLPPPPPPPYPPSKVAPAPAPPTSPPNVTEIPSGSAFNVSADAGPSLLWGFQGELWHPSGQLNDVSFAGYGMGDAEPPRPRVRTDVRDFGAVGDGVADDSEALEAAAKATPRNGVLYLPAGTYRLTRVLKLYNRQIIIRGAGVDATTLYYPFSQKDLDERGYEKDPGAFSSTGFFMIVSATQPPPRSAPSVRLAAVVSPAERGERVLLLDSTARLSKGQVVVVTASDAGDGALPQYLFGDAPILKQSDLIGGSSLMEHVSEIAEVINASAVRLVRPLPLALRPGEWRDVAVAEFFDNRNSGAGIEDLRVRFEPAGYLGHLTEAGYNWLYMQRQHNCWVRNVRISNADFALQLHSSNFCTIDNVTVDAEIDRSAWNQKVTRGSTGHHGIAIKYGGNNVVKNFQVLTTQRHDVSLLGWTFDNVIRNGRGTDLAFDAHSVPACGNLIQDVDCGRCSRMWAHGGIGNFAAVVGMFNTFWRVGSRGNASLAMDPCLPPESWGSNVNFVGLQCQQGVPQGAKAWTKEYTHPWDLVPADLHGAMKQRRRDSEGAYP